MWAAGAIVVLLVVAVAWLQLGAVLVVRHRAESAADRSALRGQ
ncbi:MAG: pilus assembly protein TadG-related protein [Acidobacteria bacterium]|nr:pilus assembly protein TadG-related protein [Acidobacteriota bacterium]